MKTKIFENLQFVTLVCLIVAQCVVSKQFYIGQGLYLLANSIATIRSFSLKRPLSDKIKDCSCLGITIGIICFNFFS